MVVKELKEFEEFDYKNYHIVTDLGSAEFDFIEKIITIQGHAFTDEKKQIEVICEPVNNAEFIFDGNDSQKIALEKFRHEIKLLAVEDVETGEEL